MGNPSRMVATSMVISKLKDSSLKELSENWTRQSGAILSFHFAVISLIIYCRALNARCMVNWLLHLKNIWVERRLLSAEYPHWEKASGTDNLCFSNLFLTKNMISMIILYSGPVINWDNPMAIKNLRVPLAKIVLKRLSGQKKMINVYVWARGVCVWAKRISTRNNEVIVWIVYEGLRRMCSYLQCTYMKISPTDPTGFS